MNVYPGGCAARRDECGVTFNEYDEHTGTAVQHVCCQPAGHAGPDGPHECDCPFSVPGAPEPCGHPSSTGIDQAPDDEMKVWRCDSCGWLHRSVRQDDGTHRMVEVPVVEHFTTCASCGRHYLRMRLASDGRWYCVHHDPEPGERP